MNLPKNFNKILALSLLLCVLALILFSAFCLDLGQWVYAIEIDGKIVGYVDSLEDYQQLVAGVTQEAEAQWQCSLIANEEVRVQRLRRWTPTTSMSRIEAKLEQTLTYLTVGWSIMVNGKVVSTVDSKGNAEAVLAAFEAQYHPTANNRTLKDLVLLDEVKIVRTTTEPQDLVDSATALEVLGTGQHNTLTYRVSRGDTLSGIARANNVPITNLRAANPQLKGDIIQIGQILSLESTEPLVRVRTVEELKVKERISPPVRYTYSDSLWYYQSRVVESGSSGSRDVMYIVELLNGHELKRTIERVDITVQPTTRVIMRGTSRWPSRSTGMFRWPLNSGRISDYFGSRRPGRSHNGVDIAVSRGTPIYAAAGGTVTTAGRDSNYGYFVVIQHNNGYSTLYAHMVSQPLVSVNQTVAAGRHIGNVGSTGRSTGPHLHFEIRRNGQHLNPLNFFEP